MYSDNFGGCCLAGPALLVDVPRDSNITGALLLLLLFLPYLFLSIDNIFIWGFLVIYYFFCFSGSDERAKHSSRSTTGAFQNIKH
jgi:uncharacterized membrane protein YhaH (DUF805 family)